ncbi:hypothetical protein AJ79_01296 [Helicocarpus griseus UAMH5409]|uniref:Uncharacterized protein n=1 Tax=Helicocarpus griseus UAMH5409 TaxID=1447875 RepID=A0A2B7Y8A7_9EURO|nr:hypothetical protein AJ79_01296 [Helicocarpus griseus UAMH5409]
MGSLSPIQMNATGLSSISVLRKELSSKSYTTFITTQISNNKTVRQALLAPKKEEQNGIKWTHNKPSMLWCDGGTGFICVSLMMDMETCEGIGNT